MAYFKLSTHTLVTRTPGDILIAKEIDNEGSRKFDAIANHTKLETFLGNIRNKEPKNYYECISDGLRRGYWDIDLYTVDIENSRQFYEEIEDKPLTADELAEHIMYDIYTRIHNSLLCYTPEVDLVICSSNGIMPNGLAKYSYHIIARNVYFPDNATLRLFTEKVMSSATKDFLHVDLTVYKEFQQFRLTKCWKYGDPRVKKILDTKKYKFEDTLLTYIIRDKFVMPHKDNILINVPRPNKIIRDKTLCDSEFIKYILTAAKKWHEKENLEWVFSYRAAFSNRIYTWRNKSSYCKICDKIHERDNSLFLSFKAKTSDIFVNCWKDDKKEICVGKLTPDMKRLLVYDNMRRRLDRISSDVTTLLDNLTPDNKLVYDSPQMQPFTLTAGTLCVKAGMGLGKTKELVNYMRDNPADAIIIISFRRTFTAHMVKVLKEMKFVSYLDIGGDIYLYDYPRLIIQVESLHRIKTRNIAKLGNTLIILDEAESIFSQFLSEFSHNRRDDFEQLKNFLDNGTRVIAMDANLSDRTYNILTRHRPKTTLYYHLNKHKRFSEYIVKIVPMYEELVLHMMAALRNGEKFGFITNSSKKAKAVKKIIGELFPHIKVFLLCGDTPSEEKKYIFNNITEIFNSHDVVIYTPTLTAGVSYEVEHFDNIFCYFTNGSCDGYICDQMMGRIRSLRKKEMFICIKSFRQGYPVEKCDIGKYISQNRDLVSNTNNYVFKALPTINYNYNYDNNTGALVQDMYLELWLDNVSVRNKFANDFFTQFIMLIKQKGCKLVLPDKCQLMADIRDIRSKLSAAEVRVFAEEAQVLVEAEDFDNDKIGALLLNVNNQTKAEEIGLKKYFFRCFYRRHLIDKPIDVEFVKKYSDKLTQNQYTNLTLLHTKDNVEDALQNCLLIAIKEMDPDSKWKPLDLLSEISSKYNKLYLQNINAHLLIKALGWNSVLDTTRLPKVIVQQKIILNSNLFDAKHIQYYKQIYNMGLNTNGESINKFSERKKLVAQIISYMYGYDIVCDNSKGKDPILNIPKRDIYYISVNPKFHDWDFKYNPIVYEGDDVVID